MNDTHESREKTDDSMHTNSGKEGELKITNSKRRMILSGLQQKAMMELQKKLPRDTFQSMDRTEVLLEWEHIYTETRAHIQEGHQLLRKTLKTIDLKPTILILQFGMNDMLSDHSPTDNYEYFEYYLDAMVSRALSDHIEVIICSPTLFGDDVYEGSLKHRALERIAGIGLSIAKIYDVTYLDLFTKLHKFNEKYNIHRHKRHVLTLGDGKSLNYAGNKIVAGLLLEVFGIHYEEAVLNKVVRNHHLLKSIPFGSSDFCKVDQIDYEEGEQKDEIIIQNALETDSIPFVDVAGANSPLENTRSLLEDDSIFSSHLD